MLPFVAACALLLSVSGTAVSQEKKEPKDKATADDISDLTKKLTATQKDLYDAKKGLEDAVKVMTALKKTAEDAAEEAKENKAALEKANTDLTATKKIVTDAIDAAKKAGTDADAKAVTAQQRGDTAWMLTASALVLFMVPGLALFYGGMVRRKNVLATMMQSMAALAVVGVYWVAIGYSLAFGPSVFKMSLMGVEEGGMIGYSSDLVFLRGISFDMYLPQYNVPVYLHVMFQGMFAIITPALISGAIAERIRFWPFCIFMILWITFVYCPLAHMVWAFDWFDPKVLAAKRGLSAIGFLGKMGALDFAGGTVVHIAAGMAGLACCLVLRRRDGYPKTVVHPNSMVLTLLGAGLLWFGWFGFNGGSAVNSTAQAVSAFSATQAAAAAAGLVWMLIEWVHRGKPTALGLASGIVAGLVAVTPASGYVYVWGGLAIGVAAAVVCYLAVFAKSILGYDDSLDAFGVHGVGGFIGAVLTGIFCTTAIYPGGGDGPFTFHASRARVKEIESKLLTDAKAAIEPAKKALADAEEAAKKVSEKDTEGAEKAKKDVTDATDKLADVEATAAGLQKELDTLKPIIEKQDKDGKTPYSQLMIQIKASVFSVVFAMVLSLALCALVQAITLGNFSTSKKDEVVGLDQTEHGEAGFDFGFATESFTSGGLEPRAATTPAGNGKYELAVNGVDAGELKKVWSSLCLPSDGPADPDFLAVYPVVTTVSGTTFRFRGGNPAAVANRLESLLKKHLPGKPVRVGEG
jgi:ammonium transporter